MAETLFFMLYSLYRIIAAMASAVHAICSSRGIVASPSPFFMP